MGRTWAGRASLATALVAVLACGCTGVAYVPAEPSDPDARAGLLSYRDELRTHCARGLSGAACWELAQYTRAQRDEAKALVYAKKACVLGAAIACHDITMRSGESYETLVAAQFAKEEPSGLSEPERCSYWEQTAERVSPSLSGLNSWVAFQQKRACDPVEQADLAAQEAEYDQGERRHQRRAALEAERRERRKPCLLSCIAGRASHLRSCRAFGELSAGPCHDRSASATRQCLALCEKIQ
jgi:hypothetical protein